MVSEPVQDELLQRYFDGDLEPGEAAKVAQQLERSPEARERLRALSALHGAIGRAVNDPVAGVDFDALFARIEKDVQQAPTPSADERAWWREHMEQPPRKSAQRRLLPAMGALAAAAVLLLAVLRGLSPQHVEPPAGSGGAEQSGAPSGTPGSEVVEVDFGSNAGTVFEIALDDGNSTPVVWINDGPEQAAQ
jgi:anti-sigma factor RsiW